MKKTGKSGFGHLKKMERMSQQMARDRLHLALAAAAENNKAGHKDRRRCK
jgi:hypothetical protein